MRSIEVCLFGRVGELVRSVCKIHMETKSTLPGTSLDRACAQKLCSRKLRAIMRTGRNAFDPFSKISGSRESNDEIGSCACICLVPNECHSTQSAQWLSAKCKFIWQHGIAQKNLNALYKVKESSIPHVHPQFPLVGYTAPCRSAYSSTA